MSRSGVQFPRFQSASRVALLLALFAPSLALVDSAVASSGGTTSAGRSASSSEVEGTIELCGPDTSVATECLLAPEEARPTQMTVAGHVVQLFQSQLQELSSPGFFDRTRQGIGRLVARVAGNGVPKTPLELFLEKHKPRVVKGPTPIVFRPYNATQPTASFYLVDNHELVLAARWVGKSTFDSIPVEVVADQSHLSLDTFWAWMKERNLLWPVNELGQHQHVNRIPLQINELKNDPFHSVAYLLSDPHQQSRRCFDRIPRNPNQIRLWAGFFRNQLLNPAQTTMIDINPNRIFEEQYLSELSEVATRYCNSIEACGLPGFRKDWLQTVCGSSRIPSRARR